MAMSVALLWASCEANPRSTTRSTEEVAESSCRVPDASAADRVEQADLGAAYRACFDRSGDTQYARKAADAFIRAADLGLKEGQILYTSEISETLSQTRDKERLRQVFERFLATDPARDPDRYYLALLDYAGGLAALGDAGAGTYFEKAVESHPRNNLEAVNRYARYLIDSGQPGKAAELLASRLTKAQRIRSVQPAYLRREALRRAGMDTAPADAEIAEIERGRGGRERR
jgi:hypothetical protein